MRNTVIPFRYDTQETVYPSVDTAIQQLCPDIPTYTLDRSLITSLGRNFMVQFPGRSLFAVKTNPHEAVIQSLMQGGIRDFDVASLAEIELVRRASHDSNLYYMHTVKSPEMIERAYCDYGVRTFALDHMDELNKILEATGYAEDLSLFVRIALPKNAHAAIDFSDKFGAHYTDAITLLRTVRKHTNRLGLCFHVGTQIEDASSFGNAINHVKRLIHDSGITLEMLDVGGGFPVFYDRDVPNISNCIDVINTALKHAGLDHLELLAEPGRCLVAEAGSLVVRVELRRDDLLYINDGTYGGLFDAGPLLNTAFPMTAHRLKGTFSKELKPYRLAGPTCDSLDMMTGPYLLPEDIRMGDYIEIRNIGAYSYALRSGFNGFGESQTVFIDPKT